jgi:PAS domain S-box-containing protein
MKWIVAYLGWAARQRWRVACFAAALFAAGISAKTIAMPHAHAICNGDAAAMAFGTGEFAAGRSEAGGMSRTGNAFVDYFTGDGNYMPRTQCLLNEAGQTDWPWIWALLILTTGVVLAYLRIFQFWMRSYFAERRADRNSKLFDLACIFLLCAVCGYVMSGLMFFWPGYRLLAVSLLALNFFSWRFCVNLRPFQKAFAANRLEREWQQEMRNRAEHLEREVAARTREVERLAQIARRTANGVIIADTQGRIEWVNEGFTRITGYSFDEVMGKKPGHLLQGPKTDHEIVNKVNQALRAGESVTAELVNYTKAGDEFVIRVEIEPLRDAAGALTGFMAIESDVTAQRRNEDELALRAREMEALRDAANNANRAKSEFLANMSHEIRTPLTAILGYTDLLFEDGDITRAPQQRVETLETIRRAGTHLLTVINDILDLSKIEAEKMSVEMIQVPVVDLIGEVVSLLAPRAKAKGVVLRSELSGPVPALILSDPTRLRQILMNIAGNATKFTQHGTVTIRVGTVAAPETLKLTSTQASTQAGTQPTAETASKSWGRLIIDVEDTGPGMSPEITSRLFLPFSQADSTVTRSHGGSGLGLSISRRLARLMGGDVTLVRSAPGEGAMFRLELPLRPVAGCTTVHDLAESRLDIEASAAEVRLIGRVLLAEDGIDNQRLISHHLRKAGAHVEVANNGLIALAMFEDAARKGTPFDLLLTDMQMPEMDGYTLATTLRERGVRTPVVALTAHAMREDRERCLSAGCDDYASKPIDKGLLLGTCARWLNVAKERSRAA